jgi:hypothetical protein
MMVDRYSKVALYVVAEIAWKAEDLADALIERVISRFGTQKGIVSYRGSLFTSKIWAETRAAIKLQRCLNTAFHPQTDGQTASNARESIHLAKAKNVRSCRGPPSALIIMSGEESYSNP